MLRSLKIDVLIDDKEVLFVLPKTLQDVINPRDLQDLLPKLAKCAPYNNKQGKVIWRVKRGSPK